MTTVYPDVLDEYACKCGDCRRTCCRDDWDVTLSAAERDAAVEVSREVGVSASGDALGGTLPLPEILRQVIEANPHAHGEADALRLSMGQDGCCRLLQPQGYCGWQLTCGSCISRICAEFPRHCVEVGGVRYVCATVACEAVVETLLGRDDPIRLLHVEGRTRHDGVAPSAGPISASDTARRWQMGFGSLVDHGVALLQDRELPLGDRVALLAWALWHACGRTCGPRAEEADVASPFEMVGDRASRGALLAEADASLPMPAATATLGLTAKLYLDACALLPVHSDHACRVLRGLGFECATGDGGRLVGARLARATPPQALPHELGVLLEHLSVLEFLRVCSRTPGEHAEWFAPIFVCWYVAMRTSLASCCQSGVGAHDEQGLVDAIVRSQRVLGHCRSSSGLSDWLRKCGMLGSGPLMALARA